MFEKILSLELFCSTSNETTKEVILLFRKDTLRIPPSAKNYKLRTLNNKDLLAFHLVTMKLNIAKEVMISMTYDDEQTYPETAFYKRIFNIIKGSTKTNNTRSV